MKKRYSIAARLKSQRGATAVYVAIMMVVFVGFVALAIDVGYMMVVRNQLQNAADAAALAGCNHFYDRAAPVTSETMADPPAWEDAVNEASNAVTINKADNKSLATGTIATGWWDITQPAPGSLWSVTNPPGVPPATPPTVNYGPAVRVTIAKTTGQNSGPISTFFSGVFGVSTIDSQKTATAVAASPGSVRPGSVIPVAISERAADQSTVYNSPSNPIIIGSPYMYSDSLAGQWTSFTEDANDVSTVRDLISNGNPTALTIGDNIWIEPGVKNTLYANGNQPSIQHNYAGRDVFLPIVDAILSNATHSAVPLVGFIGFHVISATGGNSATITGYFTTAPFYGGPIGPHYGPLDRCRLCQ